MFSGFADIQLGDEPRVLATAFGILSASHELFALGRHSSRLTAFPEGM